MAEEPSERCLCGRWPRFACVQTSEDYVSSWFSCPTGQRIPGGGTRGCGRQGPEVEDNFAQRSTAAMLWDRSIREARRGS